MTKYTIFYGRRRSHFVILLSAILTWLVNTYLVAFIALPRDIRAIGHIIPGLIANDMLRQGVMRTVLSLALSTAFVYLCRFSVLVLYEKVYAKNKTDCLLLIAAAFFAALGIFFSLKFSETRNYPMRMYSLGLQKGWKRHLKQ